VFTESLGLIVAGTVQNVNGVREQMRYNFYRLSGALGASWQIYD
jgi:hypothetical protein